MVGILVFQLVVEDVSHRTPYIVGADGELADLYGLRLRVVYAGTIELIADGAGLYEAEQRDSDTDREQSCLNLR